jgi:hypothetical protein
MHQASINKQVGPKATSEIVRNRYVVMKCRDKKVM